jgi:hypothetical protein
MSEPDLTFIAEYPCERRCQVEFDVTDVNARFTNNQMRLHADAAHKAAHQAEPPRRAYRFNQDVLVKAGAL